LAHRPLLALALLATLWAAGPALAMDVVDLTPPLTGDDGTRTTPRDDPDPPLVPENPIHAASSTDDYEAPTLQTRHFGLQIELTCRAASTAGGLELVNKSGEPLPPGTRIKWQFRQDRLSGFFAITGPLGAGRRMVADDILGDRAPGGECTARVI
jgi:hypothetical protein